LHGVELNIGPNGELDYDLEFRRASIGASHRCTINFELDRAAQTKRIVTAMQEPHRAYDRASVGANDRRPAADRPRPRCDLCSRRSDGTALEVNGALPRLDMSAEALRRARGRDVTLVLTSDAHHADELDRVRFRGTQRRSARGSTPTAFANAWPAERLIQWATQGVR